ncbi:hypothetical protein Ancab_013827 [Ancistrocladus abbreviatus]
MMDPADTVFNPHADICQQLLDRYSGSSAAHHRHLCATAAAMRSILLDGSLPLSPLSYFAATITATDPSSDDAASVAALVTFLSILLPLVPEGSIAPEKAVDAAEILVTVLERPSQVVSTSNVKCVVKCLGVLAGFCDLEDWYSVKLIVEKLLKCSMDKRPKVRKCAQHYTEKTFKSFQSPSVVKRASKMVLSLFKSYIALVARLGGVETANRSKGETLSESEQVEAAHVFNIMKLTVPHLSRKTSVRVVRELFKLFDSHSSPLTRPILDTIEAFFGNFEVEVRSQVAEDAICSLSSYASMKENPADTLISAANLLKIAFNTFHTQETSEWLKNLQLVVTVVAGLLIIEDDTASQASNILKDLINNHINSVKLPSTASQHVNDEATSGVNPNAVTSICSVFENLLDTLVGIPNGHMLDVLSFLFLKLGEPSYVFMRRIVLQLAEFAPHSSSEMSDTDPLQKCIGCAVFAMGPEKFLSLIPISFNEGTFTCSNTWLIPIMKKYVFRASLGYFMDHIVPTFKSLKMASHKVKKSVIAQDLQAQAQGLWGLLPAFCRHPTDIGSNFESFAKLILTQLEEDSSLLEDIATALQELVKENKCVLQSRDDSDQPTKHFRSLSLEDSLSEYRSLLTYSRKIAAKNIKAMSSCSAELLQSLANIFLSSTPEKRLALKDAIQCLASISDSSVTKKILISSLERFELVHILCESGKSNASLEASYGSSSTRNDLPWCLILGLASSLVVGANEDLVGVIFSLVKHILQVGDRSGFCEVYYTLSRILEEHSWFCSSKFDELVDLLISQKAPADINSLRSRVVSLQILLVHALKSISDAGITKAFTILNEIILTLKDSNEEARKTAYDVLLQISSSLQESKCVDPDQLYSRLISMMMGYLSSSSPHMMSGAISALSVLVYKEPNLCLSIPDLVPSVVELLQSKAVEVIKAVLGFAKVIVSCLQAKDLQNFVSSIINGVVPWSSVSRHHFRSKVTVILEILIRKCGSAAVESVTPEKYRAFLKNVLQNRRGKTTSKEVDSNDWTQQRESSANGQNKRVLNENNMDESGSLLHKRKRRKWQDSSDPNQNEPRTSGSSWSGDAAGFGNKSKSFGHGKPYSSRKLNKGKRRDLERAPSRQKKRTEHKKVSQRGGGNGQRPATNRKTFHK